MKFKTSVLQDKMGRQPLSGQHSGLQSGIISHNQTPEASNNVPLNLLNQKQFTPLDSLAAADQGSIYITNPVMDF